MYKPCEPERTLACTLEDLFYELPSELIAQEPPPNREDARLFRVHRPSGDFEDRCIAEIPSLLLPGDLLVLNETKVVPAKFHLRRATGGKVEALFLHEDGPDWWRILLRGSSRLRPGETLTAVSPSAMQPTFTLLERRGEGQWLVHSNTNRPVEQVLDEIGETPLPPYILLRNNDSKVAATDHARYQTVYARVPGAVAAPTAGLHLTERLLGEIRKRGVEVAAVTLHVGLGTFKPIAVRSLAEHVMHEERFIVPEATAASVNSCRRRGGRVVAVGTTSVRALESSASDGPTGEVRAMSGTTNLFIRPPYPFRVVDALLTNFHLPKSTLLALVMAFAGVETIRRAYRHAVDARYRFFSYGDAMFIT